MNTPVVPEGTCRTEVVRLPEEPLTPQDLKTIAAFNTYVYEGTEEGADDTTFCLPYRQGGGFHRLVRITTTEAEAWAAAQHEQPLQAVLNHWADYDFDVVESDEPHDEVRYSGWFYQNNYSDSGTSPEDGPVMFVTTVAEGEVIAFPHP